METRTITALPTTSALADQLQANRYRTLHFSNRQLRDEVAAELRKRGESPRKSVSSGSRLHPEYVTDFIGTYETGFGNSDYQRHWSKLYNLSIALDR